MTAKAGRPKQSKPPKVRVQVLLEQADFDKLNSHSLKTGQPLGEVTRRAVVAGMATALKGSTP